MQHTITSLAHYKTALVNFGRNAGLSMTVHLALLYVAMDGNFCPSCLQSNNHLQHSK